MSDDLTDFVHVRYMVDDVDAAVDFYTRHLGFAVRPDGATPSAGGWNRIHLIVDDIAAEVDRLRDAGVSFRNDIVSGPGGRQILLQDPVLEVPDEGGGAAPVEGPPARGPIAPPTGRARRTADRSEATTPIRSSRCAASGVRSAA